MWPMLMSLFLWLIILPVIVPLLPFCVLIWLIKTIEEFIYRKFYSSIHFKIEEIPWLYDTPENPTITNCLVVMETRMKIESIRNVLDERFVNARTGDDKKLLKYPRATRYIHPGYSNYYWLKEEKFQIEDHVYEFDKHCYESEAALKDVISGLATRPLITNENLSPWEYIIIHFKQKGDERTAIFFRCHHSLADGISLMYFLVNQLSDNKFEYGGAGVNNLTATEKWMIQIKSVLLFPYNALGQAPKIFRAAKTTFDIGKISGKKRLTYSKPISLDLVKAIKQKLNVTVNDVMSGCLATCLHNYLRKEIVSVPADFYTAVPLNTRLSIEEAKEFSNKIAVTQFALPTSSGDPIKNIQETNKRMNKVKRNLVGFSIRLTMRIIGYFAPMFATNYVIGQSICSVNMVLSNVPGPQQEVRIAGNKMRFLTFWPPAKNKISSSCSIFSYNGNVYIGICSDENATKYPERIIADIEDVLNSLAKMTGVIADGYIVNKARDLIKSSHVCDGH